MEGAQLNTCNQKSLRVDPANFFPMPDNSMEFISSCRTRACLKQHLKVLFITLRISGSRQKYTTGLSAEFMKVIVPVYCSATNLVRLCPVN